MVTAEREQVYSEKKKLTPPINPRQCSKQLTNFKKMRYFNGSKTSRWKTSQEDGKKTCGEKKGQEKQGWEKEGLRKITDPSDILRWVIFLLTPPRGTEFGKLSFRAKREISHL